MNGFEKFLKEKSKTSGKIELDSSIWDSIEANISSPKTRSNSYILRIAASFLILIMSGLLIKYFLPPTPSNDLVILMEYDNESGSLEGDLKIELYQRVQELKKNKIPRSLISNFDLLVDEFYALDKEYPQVDSANSLYVGYQGLENQIFWHYTKKLKILERIEQEILKINKIEKDNNYENKKILLSI